MKISIFGLGYVGAVSAACLASDGHYVVCVDIVQDKVDLINKGIPPIIESELEEISAKALKSKSLIATTSATEAIKNTQISLICVGTPSQLNGNLDLKYVRRVCEKIGSILKSKDERHIVVIRSTILPGTMRNVVIPILEKSSGKKAGVNIGVCHNPEFLREGTAVYDFFNPSKTVIGELDTISGNSLSSIYEKIDAPIIRTSLETAEMVKYVDNSWHALKVGFANEIGNICKSNSIDGHEVMDIFCQDTKLNISSKYLKPGFAFGGSCLPKDLRALTYKGRNLDLDLPILNSILASNNVQIERGIRMILEKRKKKVGILGFSFKAGTDDLRESPIVEVIERLLGKGYFIKIYDKNVSMAKLFGANRDFILNHIPHISNLMVDTIDEVLSFAETIVIGNKDPEFESIFGKIKEGQKVIDFVRVNEKENTNFVSDGICW
jgi:GDP-mannose 6-dehydrogenase